LNPEKKIEYNITTGFDNIWLIHTLTKMDKTTNTIYQTVSNKQSVSSVQPVAEQDRGGMAMSYAFVQHNRIYKGGESFDIPWSNKELNITYSTFRDKLLPGANEKWTVKITGHKGEQVAAEMLAGMYDASLDQFKPHSWNRINIWPGLYNTVNWQEKGFNKVESEEYNKLPEYNQQYYKKIYDRLAYFGGAAYGDFNTGTYYDNFQHDLNPDVRYNSGVVLRSQASMAATIIKS